MIHCRICAEPVQPMLDRVEYQTEVEYFDDDGNSSWEEEWHSARLQDPATNGGQLRWEHHEEMPEVTDIYCPKCGSNHYTEQLEEAYILLDTLEELLLELGWDWDEIVEWHDSKQATRKEAAHARA
jgi:hypothetical protein